MKKFLLSFFLAYTFNAYALPPQAEADKLMIEARTAMDAREYSSAAQSLSRAETLKAKLPASFAFHYGVALMETGDYAKAKQQLNLYITNAGAKGKFYKEALEAYSKTEVKERAYVQAMGEYDEAKAQYKEKLRGCPDEYKKYTANLEAQFMALVRECDNYGKYGCTQYHDDRRAVKMVERLDAARYRNDNAPYESEWCRDRYTAPKAPLPQ